MAEGGRMAQRRTDENELSLLDQQEETLQANHELLSAYEYVIRARGALYEFHHLIAQADSLFESAAKHLNEVGHPECAGYVQRVVGRDVLPGLRTHELVEGFDDSYWRDANDAENEVRKRIMHNVRHSHNERHAS